MLGDTTDIKAVILFGSHARGDNTDDSDIDFCVITSDDIQRKIIKEDLPDYIEKQYNSDVSLSVYSNSMFTEMLEYGSLFLWHLKLEGKVLFGEEYFNSSISRLKKFEKHIEEINYHKELLDDLIKSHERINSTTIFDFSLLFTIARNTCMILSHKYGYPSFGRFSSFLLAKKLFHNLPISFDEYSNLSKYKILYEREERGNATEGIVLNFTEAVRAVESLLNFSYSKIDF